jgi:hypothetical protein
MSDKQITSEKLEVFFEVLHSALKGNLDDDIWAVEYSTTQDAFHIEPLRHSFEATLKAFVTGNIHANYKLLAITRSFEEGSKLTDELRARKKTVHRSDK